MSLHVRKSQNKFICKSPGFKFGSKTGKQLDFANNQNVFRRAKQRQQDKQKPKPPTGVGGFGLGSDGEAAACTLGGRQPLKKVSRLAIKLSG